jgi:hypothetical protein
MTTFELQSALASSENAVMVTFPLGIFCSGLLDPEDGLDPVHYSVQPVVGTIGMDGTQARPVSPIVVTFPDVDSGLPLDGSVLIVTLDRAMTPYPAQYTIRVTGVFSEDLSEEITPTNVQFPAVYRQLVPPSNTVQHVARDIANPQTLIATGGLPANSANIVLGTFQYDTTGDYAFDDGMVAFKKRVFRRIISNPGGFLHLGQNYGVGIKSYGKLLGTPARKNQLVAAVESQLSQEPEVSKVLAQVLTSIQPGFFALAVIIALKTGGAVKYQGLYPMQ